jgi:hypothetical protein
VSGAGIVLGQRIGATVVGTARRRSRVDGYAPGGGRAADRAVGVADEHLVTGLAVDVERGDRGPELAVASVPGQ